MTKEDKILCGWAVSIEVHMEQQDQNSKRNLPCKAGLPKVHEQEKNKNSFIGQN